MMLASKSPGRSLAIASALLLASVALFPAPATGQAPAATGKPADLLKSPPFDRMTLIDGTVVDIEPVSPRPLAPPEAKKPRTLVEIEEASRKAELKRQRRTNSDGFTKVERDDEDEEPIIVRTLVGENNDYKVRRLSIKGIEYFEDLLLADGDRKIASGDFLGAFERFLLVRSRNAGWPGLAERVNKLLYRRG